MPEARETERSKKLTQCAMDLGAVMFFDDEGYKLAKILYQTGKDRINFKEQPGFCLVRAYEDRNKMPEFTRNALKCLCEIEISNQLFEVHKDLNLET